MCEHELVRFIREQSPWLILSGAGISTESGIPDFRSPGSGLWDRYDPMAILSTDVLYHDPRTFYRVGYPVLKRFRNALPNPAHQVLADWEKRGWVRTVVTQNIDSLHVKAGNREVLEIHGHLRTCSCLSCRNTFPIERIDQRIAKGIIPPRCRCSGILRPDVVLFGDRLPEDFVIAETMAHQYPLMVIGSSLTVSPANLLPSVTPVLVIVNLGETPYDHRAIYCIREKAGIVLPRWHDFLVNASRS